MAALISALAYLALALLLAGGPGLFKCLRGRQVFGLAGPWAGLLFIPNDSLPPFIDLAWSGPAFWLGLLLGPSGQAVRGLRRRCSESRLAAPVQDSGFETLLRLLVLMLAWLSLCFYAQRLGLPGDLPGLSIFAATPLLTQSGPAGRIGLICLFIALSPLAARPEADKAGPARLMTSFSISAFLVCAFFPFAPSAFLGISGPFGPGLDFSLFWAKVLLLNRLIAPRLARAIPWGR